MRAGAAQLIAIAQEAGMRHMSETPYSMSALLSAGFGWVILAGRYVFGRRPAYGETVAAETSQSEPKGFLTNRNYRITDALGGTVMTGIVSCVYTDLSARKPVRVPPEQREAFGSEPPLIPADYKIPDMPGERTETEFAAARRDTDTNGHVNNIKYIEWALDQIPKDVYLSRNARELRAVYKKECAAGAPVRIETGRIEDAKEFCVNEFRLNHAKFHQATFYVSDIYAAGELSARVYTEWE